MLFLEETAQDPVGALAEIFDFIGLDLVDEEGKEVWHYNTDVLLLFSHSRL